MDAHLVGQHDWKVGVDRRLPCHGVGELRTDNIEPVHRRLGDWDLQSIVCLECLKDNMQEPVELEGIMY